MSGLVYTRTDSGLVLAEHGMDEAAVARSLKEIDPDLRLVRQPSDKARTIVWKVCRYMGSERPVEFITAWEDGQGNPLPLSHSLVEKVKDMDQNPGRTDPDRMNREAKEKRATEIQVEQDEMAREYAKREKRSPVLPRTRNPGNHRWKEDYFQSKKRRRSR